MRTKLDISVIKDRVDKAGQVSNNKLEQYDFVSLAGKTKHNTMLVKIKNRATHKIRTVQYSHLVWAGHNPFNLTHDCHEVNVIHPKVKSYLSKLDLKIEQEVKISEHSRVDFVCTNKLGKKIIIEVKSDIKRHTSKNLTAQINRYIRDGKKLYGKDFKRTYLVSINGTYGFSLKELGLMLKQDNFV